MTWSEEKPAVTGLPRLLYVGDVPVRDTFGSKVLLYRLLEEYPPELLRIVESNFWFARGEPALPGVRYRTVKLGPTRLRTTRLAGPYGSYLYLSAPVLGRAVGALYRGWGPEAVLTIGVGAGWRAGAEAARALGVPLHLITHDDPPGFFSLSGPLEDRADRDFGAVYREARSRLCICPGMAERYAVRYGVPGSVVYPLRSRNAPQHGEPPPPRLGCFTLAYAGDIHFAGGVRTILEAARVLEALDGRLLVYTSRAAAGRLAHAGAGKNVTVRPPLPAGTNVDRLRDEADALLLPMSFDDTVMAADLSFPSKIVDYTATGLPMIIWAPAHSSAVRWTREAGGSGEIVTDQSPDALRATLERLAADPQFRRELGARSLWAGNRDFSHGAVTSQFYRALTQ